MALSNKSIKLLKEFTNAYGGSGSEVNITRLMNKYLKQYCDEIVYDNLGSIYGVKYSHQENPLRVMVCAHSDEVGFVVTDVNDQGLICFKAVGGIWNQVLMAQRVVLINSQNHHFNGAISAMPPHLLSEELRNKPVPIDKMVADFGFISKEDAFANGVKKGDRIFVCGDFEILNENRVLAKAVDDRLGCALIVELLDNLKNTKLDYDLYIGLNVMEEVGLRGAQTAAQMIKPDMAIVIDCSPANDLLSKNELGVLGEGVLLRVCDSSMIAFASLIEFQRKICEKNNIKHQYFISNGGNDAGIIHKSNSGILTLTSCICARNIHSNSTIMDTNDYNANLKFLKIALRKINRKLYENFLKDKQ